MPTQRENKYYYKVNGCPAHHADDEDCICWHDIGTGPLSDDTPVKEDNLSGFKVVSETQASPEMARSIEKMRSVMCAPPVKENKRVTVDCPTGIIWEDECRCPLPNSPEEMCKGCPLGDTFDPCPFATSVSKKIAERAKVGKEKYGVTCARTDLDLHAWLTHLQEELMDAAVYIERAKSELNES